MDEIFKTDMFERLESELECLSQIIELNGIEFEKIGDLKTPNLINKLWQLDHVNFTIISFCIGSDEEFEFLEGMCKEFLSLLFHLKSVVKDSIQKACDKQSVKFKDEFVIKYLHDDEMDYIVGLDDESKEPIYARIDYALELCETKDTKKINGVEIETKSILIQSHNVLGVEVGTTGYKGGKYNCGGRTYFSIENHSGAVMYIAFKEDKFEIALEGDSELQTFMQALEFALSELKSKVGK